MTISELKDELDKRGIEQGSYSLNGELLPYRVVLDHVYGKWIVFYFSERGTRDDEKVFFDEGEACQYVLKLLSW